MSKTRDKFITVATEHFADRGFYGASVAQISDELKLTKQALLHHFGSKEKLYAEVLLKISTELMQSVSDSIGRESDLAKPERVFSDLCQFCLAKITMTQLLIRELLDNKRRAEHAKQWYLRDFLDVLIEVVLADPRSKAIDEIEGATIVYQLLGAINYFAISKPTFTQIYGDESHRQIENNYHKEISALVSSRINAYSERG